MKQYIPPFLLTLLTTLILSSCNDKKDPVDAPISDDNNLIRFTILQMNDVYEISPLQGGKVGGLARVATVKKELEAEGDTVIAILAGDFLSPSLIGNLKVDGEKVAGKHMVEVLNAMGLDYVTFGNHEFDIKYPELQDRMDEADFLFTTCNAFHLTDSGYAMPFQQHGYQVSDWLMKEVIHEKDTVYIGFVGVVLPFNKKPFVHYLDVDSMFLKTVDDIADDCAVTIGITHLLMEGDARLAEKTKGVPLFVGGHDHSHMLEQVGDVRVAKADANAKSVYIHRITYNKSTGETSIQSELKTIDDSIEDDPAVAEVVQKWNTIAQTELQNMGFDPFEVIATLEEPLDGTEHFVRHNPAPLGKLMGRALIDTKPGTQIALINSGSIRIDDWLEGNITQGDILRTLPFGGGIVYTKIKGEQLKAILEIGTETNMGSGGYLQVAGAEWDNFNWLINDQQIRDDAMYTVVGPEYLMSGRESNLEQLGKLKKEQPETLPNGVRNDIRDVMVHYLRNGGK